MRFNFFRFRFFCGVLKNSAFFDDDAKFDLFCEKMFIKWFAVIAILLWRTNLCQKHKSINSYTQYVFCNTWMEQSCDPSYKTSTIVTYDSRVVPDLKIPPFYNYRAVIYDRRDFIRLATEQSSILLRHHLPKYSKLWSSSIRFPIWWKLFLEEMFISLQMGWDKHMISPWSTSEFLGYICYQCDQ